ncbi:acyltransferase family protein [Rathayibacter sp. YIM 133350]|uniref:acyltransferase family protein n=1 Tax=Rathayibacter sp. YIM 133350 TaxID=3131992 RepID=UPI00307E9CBD
MQHEMSAPKTRLDWVDVAKGISILLVVSVHTFNWLSFIGLQAEWLQAFNRVFNTMRMPLFFAMSGLFGVKWMTKGWRELYSGKLALFIWVFLLWQPLVFLYKYTAALILPDQQDSTLAAHLLRLFASPFRPSGELWFLWALAIFFVVARACAKLPVWLHIGGAALVSGIWLTIAQPILGDSLWRLIGDGWQGVPSYYVFFAIGVTFRTSIVGLVDRARWWQLPIPIAVWLLVQWAVYSLGIVFVPFVGLAMRVLGLAAGIAIALILRRVRPLSILGRNTLPVYLGHTLFIVLIACGLYAVGITLEGPVLGVVAPILMIAVAVMLSLALEKAAIRSPLRVFYEPPEWFRFRPRTQVAAAAPVSTPVATEAPQTSQTGPAPVATEDSRIP